MPTFVIPNKYNLLFDKLVIEYTNSNHKEVHNLFQKIYKNKIYYSQEKIDMSHFYNSISAFYINKKDSGYHSCKSILTNMVIDMKYIFQTLNNITFYLNELNNDKEIYTFLNTCKLKLNIIDNPKLYKQFHDIIMKMNIKKNICIIIFTTSRYEYLEPTLESLSNMVIFDTSLFNVYTILIDDYPLRRNLKKINTIKNKYNIHHIILNEKNLGQSITWKKIWQAIPINTDYIWHQEDDFIFNETIYVDKLIHAFETSPINLLQLSLKRNQCYNEKIDFVYKIDNNIIGEDVSYNSYNIVTQKEWFLPHPGIYPYWISKQKYDYNPQEGVILNKLLQLYPNYSPAVFGKRGCSNHITHIGEYTQGSKVLLGEPGWETFCQYDPTKKYYSNQFLQEYK